MGKGKFLKRNITKLLPLLPNVLEDSSAWPPLSQPRPREKLPVSVLEIFLFLRQSGNSLQQSCYIYIYISSRTINLSLPVLVEKRIIHLVEDNAFNLIDMFTRNEFFDKIFVYFFFLFFWQSLVSMTNVYTIILSTGWWIANIWAIWHSRIVHI